MRSERGSTIIEVIVALVVLSLGVLPLIALMGQGYRFQGHARFDVQIATLAEAKLEELIAVAGTESSDTVALNPGGSLEFDAPDHWDTVVLDVGSFTRRWEVQTGPAAVRDVTVRVIRTQPASSRVIELSTQLIHD